MIYSIGEALIDVFMQNGHTIELAGGSSANLLATVAKLGGSAAIITKLGMDSEADYLIKELIDLGVDISKIKFDSKHPTGKVLISPLDKGSALCSNRRHCADYYLEENDVEDILLKSKDILHFCSFSLIESQAKYAVIKAVKAITASGGKVAFDINLRLRQWNNSEECISAINNILPYIDFLKASCEELNILYPNTPINKIISEFFYKSQSLCFVLLTNGDAGSSLYFRNDSVIQTASHNVYVVDSTGAGDCFFGAMLYCIEEAIECDKLLDKENYKKILDFASAAASLQVQTLGAIAGIPTIKAVKKKLHSAKPN